MPRIARGYHGTSLEVAQQILAGTSSLRASKNPDDWLGAGIYFFEDAPFRARTFARWRCQINGGEPAVLRAEIELAGCVDLYDAENFHALQHFYPAFEEFEARLELGTTGQAGLCVLDGKVFTTESAETNPRKRPPIRNFRDRAVIDWYVGTLQERGVNARSVRALFLDGLALFPTSFLFNWAHAQIAVIDPSAITSLSLVDFAKEPPG